MENLLEVNLEEQGYKLEFGKEFADLYVNQQKKAILCVLKAEYIPIKAFKETFQRITQLVEKHQLTTFIFDKRSLTTFHQPSMEWYYKVWKLEVLAMGLRFHRKILPEENWFRKAVEIARREIESSIDQEAFKNINISYLETLSEALDFEAIGL